MNSAPSSASGTGPVVRTGKTRAQILLAYAAFVFVGISAGVGGVAIPAQMADYGIDRTTIGLTFFTFSAGFLLAGLSTGAVIHRFGLRAALVLGASVQLAGALATASRPSFVVLLALGLPAGYAIGLLESALNTQLAQLPGAGPLLNRLHAFFGVGALIGPIVAARLLEHYPWTAIWLLLAVLTVPLLVGFVVLHPRPAAAPPDQQEPGEPQDAVPLLHDGPVPDGLVVPEASGEAGETGRGLLATTLRERSVLLGAVLLTTYVGAELGVGTWAFSYLTEHRTDTEVLAGALVSGYWAGLTVGRFVIMPLAARLGVGLIRTTTLCLLGVVLSCLVAWLSPVWPLTAAGLLLTGFFLGPMFPTIMAVTPAMTEAARVPTAIGVLNGVSVVGGSLLPWFAGVLAQHIALWTLWPFTIALIAVQLLIWRSLAPRIASRLPDDA